MITRLCFRHASAYAIRQLPPMLLLRYASRISAAFRDSPALFDASMAPPPPPLIRCRHYAAAASRRRCYFHFSDTPDVFDAAA